MCPSPHFPSFQKKKRVLVTITTLPAAALAENYLKGGEVHEAYAAIRGWYRGITNKPPKPTHRDEESVRKEYETLFSRGDPEGDPIPIHIEPSPINDEPPNEKEVVRALKRLRLGKSPGASRIRAEDLRRWHRLAREPDEGEEPLLVNVRRWEKILKLLNLAFTTGEVPKAFCNGVLVLIPKSSPGEYRGIALLEIIYKLMSTIINSRLASTIKFDYEIHGFRAGRGTGTAIMEAKLRMQLHTRSHIPLYMIFMDLKKAYDTLDRNQAVRVLKGYGVGPAIIRIIERIWEGDTMFPKCAVILEGRFVRDEG